MEALLTGTPPGKSFCRDGKEAQQANSHDEMLEKLLCSVEKLQQLGIVSLKRVRGKVERNTAFGHKTGSVCCIIGEDGKIDGVCSFLLLSMGNSWRTGLLVAASLAPD